MNIDLLKMVAMKVVRFEGGEISVYGRGMVLVPAETILQFREALEKEIGTEKADLRMVEIGKGLTVESTKRYVDNRKNLRPVFQQAQRWEIVIRQVQLGRVRLIARYGNM